MSTPAPGTWKPLRIFGGKAQQTAGRDDFGRRLLLWICAVVAVCGVKIRIRNTTTKWSQIVRQIGLQCGPAVMSWLK